MKDSSGNNEQNHHSERDELWELLGHAPQPPQASPFFARNVVREVRSAPTRSRWFAFFKPLAAGAVVLVAATLAYQAFVFSGDDNRLAASGTVLPDVELLEEFDNLIAYSY